MGNSVRPATVTCKRQTIHYLAAILHAYDDHEIADDYAGDGDDLQGPFLNATSAFKTYAADLNYDPIHKGTYYYDFRYGDSAFFVMDARRYRTSSTEDMDARVFLGDEQSVAFHEWLHRVRIHPPHIWVR